MSNAMRTIIFAVAAIICVTICANAYKTKFNNTRIISVTGQSQESFTSDLIVWQGNFAKSNFNLKEASIELEQDKRRIQAYLKNFGINDKDIVFSAVRINQLYDNVYDSNGNYSRQVFNGYNLSQTVRIESTDVEKVERLSREVSDLIADNIELTSNDPEYFYTKLTELKLKMIENATADAKKRAEIIAQNADGKLKKLKSANMGVIQIIGKNTSEDYSWGGNYNTLSKDKTASITIKLEYIAK